MNKLDKTMGLASKLAALAKLPNAGDDRSQGLVKVMSGVQKKRDKKPESMARNAVEKFMLLKMQKALVTEDNVEVKGGALKRDEMNADRLAS